MALVSIPTGGVPRTKLARALGTGTTYTEAQPFKKSALLVDDNTLRVGDIIYLRVGSVFEFMKVIGGPWAGTGLYQNDVQRNYGNQPSGIKSFPSGTQVMWITQAEFDSFTGSGAVVPSDGGITASLDRLKAWVQLNPMYAAGGALVLYLMFFSKKKLF